MAKKSNISKRSKRPKTKTSKTKSLKTSPKRKALSNRSSTKKSVKKALPKSRRTKKKTLTKRRVVKKKVVRKRVVNKRSVKKALPKSRRTKKKTLTKRRVVKKKVVKPTKKAEPSEEFRWDDPRLTIPEKMEGVPQREDRGVFQKLTQEDIRGAEQDSSQQTQSKIPTDKPPLSEKVQKENHQPPIEYTAEIHDVKSEPSQVDEGPLLKGPKIEGSKDRVLKVKVRRFLGLLAAKKIPVELYRGNLLIGRQLTDSHGIATFSGVREDWYDIELKLKRPKGETIYLRKPSTTIKFKI